MARSFREELPVESDDLRDVRDGVFGQSSRTRSQQHVPRRVGESKVARQWDDYNRGDSAAIEGVALDDEHWPPKPRARSRRLGQVCPEDIPLGDNHLPLSRAENALGGCPNERIGPRLRRFVQRVESRCDRRRVVAGNVIEKSLAVELAPRFLQAPGKPFSLPEDWVRNRDCRFHTKSITRFHPTNHHGRVVWSSSNGELLQGAGNGGTSKGVSACPSG